MAGAAGFAGWPAPRGPGGEGAPQPLPGLLGPAAGTRDRSPLPAPVPEKKALQVALGSGDQETMLSDSRVPAGL